MVQVGTCQRDEECRCIQTYKNGCINDDIDPYRTTKGTTEFHAEIIAQKPIGTPTGLTTEITIEMPIKLHIAIPTRIGPPGCLVSMGALGSSLQKSIQGQVGGHGAPQ